mmetsp:Transcript_16779/g.28323  ORF Transcript_16779/g.28323 Transcript_16779/m.28323 type:complete len:287 (-) Transcript_16779:969-1829(-)
MLATTDHLLLNLFPSRLSPLQGRARAGDALGAGSDGAARGDLPLILGAVRPQPLQLMQAHHHLECLCIAQFSGRRLVSDGVGVHGETGDTGDGYRRLLLLGALHQVALVQPIFGLSSLDSALPALPPRLVVALCEPHGGVSGKHRISQSHKRVQLALIPKGAGHSRLPVGAAVACPSGPQRHLSILRLQPFRKPSVLHRILVAGENQGGVGNKTQLVVERAVHVSRVPMEERPHPPNEQRVSAEQSLRLFHWSVPFRVGHRAVHNEHHMPFRVARRLHHLHLGVAN